MENIPEVVLGIAAVSRDCFPMSLSENRRKLAAKAYREKYGEIFECETCIENELDMKKALEELKKAGCNALVVYLGNFGPETAETLLAKEFDGPVMFAAAAEETQNKLTDDRGDAYCGMLNASYNLKLRNVKAYIPEYPVGTAEEVADMIHDFVPVARAVKDMEKELGEGNKKPQILLKLAQYELTLLDWIDKHRGSRKYVAIAGKCWPAFQTQFGFVPCYVNSRLTAKGIPVSCEVDIYGALSEFIGMAVSQDIVTLLDINNTVPDDMYESEIRDSYEYSRRDVFMGFHCGNTASEKLSSCEMKNQLIMTRTLPEESTQGTLEGDIIPGDITFYRLQSTSDSKLRAYIAQGEVLPVRTRSFGGIGVFAIPEMGRFYRHVLIEKNFPHHGAVAFGHFGKLLFEVFRYLGVEQTELDFNRPKGMLYPSENPFA